MRADGRHRFAMYWAAGCGGCDISVLNIHEALLDVAEQFEIVFWPAVMDAKYADLEAMPDASIDLALFTGGIRNSENVELARLLRRKSAAPRGIRFVRDRGLHPGAGQPAPGRRAPGARRSRAPPPTTPIACAPSLAGPRRRASSTCPG